MPVTRKRKATRQVWRRKKSQKTSTRNKVVSTNLRNQVYYFRRMNANPGAYTGNVLHTPLLQGWSWNLGQLANVSEFSNLFDHYCITCIVVKFYLKIDPSSQTAATASYPKLYYCRDYDDSTAPGTLNELREHQHTQVRVMNPNRPVTIKLRPSTLAQTYRGVGTVSYTPQWKQWIDMAQTDVPHYGLKWGIDDLTNTNYRVDTETFIYFKCKGVR